VAAVGATAAQSIYYMPQNDLSVTAYHSRGVEAGSMRGYGTLQSMAATEMMVDEIAGRLGVDAIDLRRKNALKSGMKNTQGAVPAGALRLHEILDKAAPTSGGKTATRASSRWTPGPGPLVRRRLRHLPERLRHRLRSADGGIEFTAEGRITLRHIGTELGTGMSTSQALVVAISSAARPTR
jgi:CO/xanthine dehydrogenase Mo-binding subunit